MLAQELLPTALSIAMIGVLILVGGGISMMRQQQSKQRGILMLVAALVLFLNVLILGLPT